MNALLSPREIREHRRAGRGFYLGARVLLDGEPGTLSGFGAGGEPCFDIDLDTGERRWVNQLAGIGPGARLVLVS